MRIRSFIALLAPLLVIAAASLQPADAGLVNISGPRHFVEESAEFDMEADWLSRSRASGVFYANNLSEKRLTSGGTFQQNPYADSTALRNASTTAVSHTVGVSEVTLNTDPQFALSGGKSISYEVFDDCEAARCGNWQNEYNDDGSAVNGFYFQFAVYLRRDDMAWVLPGTPGQMKIFNLEQSTGGQVVVMSSFHLGFPNILLNSDTIMDRSFASVPYKGGGDFFYQSGIDSGSDISAGTREVYLRRYGPGREIFNNLQDYSYKDTTETGGNPSQNLLYNRGFAWPNADALLSGAEPWNFDGWTVVEVYINNAGEANPVEGIDVVKMWVAPYGEAPVLVADMANTNDDLGTGVDGYRHFEPLWYDTAFETGASGEDVGYRPTQHRWYSEFLGSTNPIEFPGGFELPSSAANEPHFKPLEIWSSDLKAVA